MADENKDEGVSASSLVDTLFALVDEEEEAKQPEADGASVETDGASVETDGEEDGSYGPPRGLHETLDSIPTDEEGNVLEQPKAKKEEEPKAEPKKQVTHKKPETEAPTKRDFDQELKELEAQRLQEEESSASVESKLGPEEEYEYKLAQFAETVDDKHKGLAEKTLTFFQKHREFVENARSEDPDVTFDEGNYEYADFLRRYKPNISDSELRKVERLFDKEEIKRETRAEFEEDMNRRQSETARKDAEPKAVERLQEYHATLLGDVVPDDLKESIENDGQEAAQKKFAIEYNVISNQVNGAVAFAKELIDLSAGVTHFSSSNPVHKQINEYIQAQGDVFYSKGGKHTSRDGKEFLPADQMAKALQLGDSDKFWTFSSDEILDMVKVETGRNIKKQVEEQEALMLNAGWKRPDGHVAPPVKKKSKATKPAKRTSNSANSTAKKVEGGSETIMNVLYG